MEKFSQYKSCISLPKKQPKKTILKVHGVEVEDNEEVLIEWPDGSITKETIKMIEILVHCGGMGHDYSHYETTAAIYSNQRGIKTRYILKGHQLKIKKLQDETYKGD